MFQNPVSGLRFSVNVFVFFLPVSFDEATLSFAFRPYIRRHVLSNPPPLAVHGRLANACPNGAMALGFAGMEFTDEKPYQADPSEGWVGLNKFWVFQQPVRACSE
ncbi:MAG: hypothetical protein AAB356_00185 [Deltaproteobacteria bacterium]